VIHLYGRVWSEATLEGLTGDVVPLAGGNADKVNPYNFGTYFRLYPGVDAIATNGLDLSDQAIRSDMGRRLVWVLHRLESAGQARKVGAGVGARWVLPTA
jgi:hypothetical protein